MDYKNIYTDDPVAVLECLIEDGRIDPSLEEEFFASDLGDRCRLIYENGKFSIVP
jgi:hypothetical protein